MVRSAETVCSYRFLRMRWGCPHPVLVTREPRVYEASALSSCVTCSAGFSFFRIAFIRRSGPMRQVVLSVPMYFFPCMLFWLFRKVSAFGCKDGWESGELTEELGVAFWAGKKVFSF